MPREPSNRHSEGPHPYSRKAIAGSDGARSERGWWDDFANKDEDPLLLKPGRNSAFTNSADETDADVKPKLPRSRRIKDNKDDGEDTKPDVKAKTKVKPTKPTGKGGAWSPDEDWALFSLLRPKIDKPDWVRIAGAIGGGRDAKSCQNRAYVWDRNKKLEAAIKNMQ